MLFAIAAALGCDPAAPAVADPGAVGGAPASDATQVVEFHHRAPGAQAVSLVGEMNGWDPAATPMTRGADGIWRVSVRLEPGQWLYKLYADGQWLTDAENRASSPDGRGGRHSYLLVGDGDFRRHPGVAHGVVETVRVPSVALGATVEANLYRPLGAHAAMPVLVLLHGQDMDRLQWTDNGLIADFMDNLLHRGEVRPLLVVMPSLTPHIDHAGLATFLAEELPDWLAAHADARPEAAARGLGGFSLGGSLTLRLAATRPGAYGLWAPMAGWLPPEQVEPWSHALAHAGPVVQYCGRDDVGIIGRNRELAAALRTAGAQADYVEVAGGHGFRFLNAVTPDLLRRASRLLGAGP